MPFKAAIIFRVNMQVDIIVECESCVVIGEVGNVLTAEKENQLRNCIDFLKCVSCRLIRA